MWCSTVATLTSTTHPPQNFIYCQGCLSMCDTPTPSVLLPSTQEQSVNLMKLLLTLILLLAFNSQAASLLRNFKIGYLKAQAPSLYWTLPTKTLTFTIPETPTWTLATKTLTLVNASSATWDLDTRKLSVQY